MSKVLSETLGAVRILTLNRPDKRNAADFEMQLALVEALQAAKADKDLRALVLTGAGGAFSAGGDRAILQQMAEGTFLGRAAYGKVHVDTIRAMLELDIPAIAAVPGFAVGYAAGLVALCDMVVMGESAFLSDPHVQFGVAATSACQMVWPRMASELVAREILMTGRRVPAEEAVQIGLATRMCPDGEELAEAMKLAELFAAMPATGVAETKRAFNAPLLEEAAKIHVPAD